ncbi:MAG: hypothetical protein FWG81_04540 [Betaproteobacteria bacterium]|nr:hypothetical protein [Betaproteobacteria bacterium]
METVGVRFPVSDIEWLAGLQIKNAVTPSDKVRAIVAQARQQNSLYDDPQACLAWVREILSPLVIAAQAEEAQGHARCEILALLLEWLPSTLAALLVLAPEADRDALRQKEKIMLGRCFQLMEAVTRLALASPTQCHDPGAIRDNVLRISELAGVLSITPTVKP